MIDLHAYIKNAYDAYDTSLGVEHVTMTHDLNMQVVGLYEVLYTLTDVSKNTISKQLTVYVQDKKPPIFTLQQPVIKLNSAFLYLEYISAWDAYDGDISHLIVLETEGFNTHKAGQYELLFSVTDSHGNMTLEKMMVTIKDEVPYAYIILAAVVCISLTVVVMVIYKKHRRKSLSF